MTFAQQAFLRSSSSFVRSAPASRPRMLCAGAGAMEAKCRNIPTVGCFCVGCADEVELGGIDARSIRLESLSEAARKHRTEQIDAAPKPAAAPPAAPKPAPAPKCRCGAAKEAPQYAVCNACFSLGQTAVWLLKAIGRLEGFAARQAERAEREKNRPAPRVASPTRCKCGRGKSEREAQCGRCVETARRAREQANAAAHRAEREAEEAVKKAVLAAFAADPAACHCTSLEGEAIAFKASRPSGSAQIVIVFEGKGIPKKSVTVVSPAVATALVATRVKAQREAAEAAEAERRRLAEQRKLQPAAPAPEKSGKDNKGKGKNGGKANGKKNGK